MDLPSAPGGRHHIEMNFVGTNESARSSIFYHFGINPSLMKRVHLLINAFVEVLLGLRLFIFGGDQY